MIKIGYGTYGMRDEDVFTALPRLREMGYEAIELMVTDGWPTAPSELDAADRTRLVTLFQELGFPPPIFLGTAKGDDPLDGFKTACELANDLNFGDDPAVICSMPPGHWDWEKSKMEIRDILLVWADEAAKHNVLLAIEPHIGMAIDTPDKADWLMRDANHPHLKLNFDYSHFYLMDIDLQHSIDLCMPHAAHMHIKDGNMLEGDQFEFLLPGAGDMDLNVFCNAIDATGTTLPVVVEVSGMVWNAPGYNAWEAAEASFKAMDDARS
ncbi:MAG: sugar phosphate isomerase/epimerase [Lentisphaeria bacterium]|nr:sugar phosphate isomerase/epimerase [Lentisphaeria bacterium]